MHHVLHFFNMVPLFSQLLRQHRRCPYSRILQRLCPLVEERDAGQGELSSVLPRHCALHRVYLFVKECLTAVIPQELWGSDHNRLNFLVRVRGLLQSGKFEKLSLAELMWKMKVNDCDWLKISKTGKTVIGVKLFVLSLDAFWPLPEHSHLQAESRPVSCHTGHRSWVSSWLGF